MFADEIRRAIEASNRIALPAVTALLWRAFGEDRITEAEAEALSALIELRQVSAPGPGGNAPGASIPNRSDSQVLRSPDRATSMPSDPALPPTRQNGPRTGVGSRPRTDASLERRRRWAASGRLPPALAARFTLAEQAVLSLVAAETARRGDCRLAIGHVASIVGVAETTVRNAMREARKLGLLTVEERRITGFRNDTNVVRVISPEWTAWLRLTRKGERQGSRPIADRRGGGCKSSNRTPTQVSSQGKTGTSGPSQRRPSPSKSSPRRASRVEGA